MNRAELLNGTLDLLNRIDEVSLTASNGTLAFRVERLMESAAPAYINFMDEDLVMSDPETHVCWRSAGCAVPEKDNLFSALYGECDADEDAADYQSSMGIAVLPRNDYRFYFLPGDVLADMDDEDDEQFWSKGVS